MSAQKLSNCGVTALVLVIAPYSSISYRCTFALLVFGFFCLALHQQRNAVVCTGMGVIAK